MLPKRDLAQPSPFFWQNTLLPINTLHSGITRAEEQPKNPTESLFRQAQMGLIKARDRLGF